MLPLKDNIPTSRFPLVTILLIALNLVAFGWQLSQPSEEASSAALAKARVSERDQAAIEYGAIPYRATHPGSECGIEEADRSLVCGEDGAVAVGGEKGSPIPDNLDMPPWWVTLLTSMSLHGDLLPTAGNLLFLWIFGNNVEDSMGRFRFLLFYLLAGLVAVYAQSALDPDSTLPTIGASGAVAGVLGAYAVLYPRARVLTLVFVIFFVTLIEIPALLMLVIWFLLQALPAVDQVAAPELAGGGGVAYLAHVGGFLFGLAAIHLFARDLAPRMLTR